MTTKPLVLIVEDDLDLQQRAAFTVEPHAEVLVAGSVEKARAILYEHGNIGYVILDGFVPEQEGIALNGSETTHELAVYIRKHLPNALIYTASSDDKINEELEKLGCVRSTKYGAAKAVVAKILDRAIKAA